MFVVFSCHPSATCIVAPCAKQMPLKSRSSASNCYSLDRPWILFLEFVVSIGQECFAPIPGEAGLKSLKTTWPPDDVQERSRALRSFHVSNTGGSKNGKKYL